MITEDCVKKFKLPTFRSSTSISGFNSGAPLRYNRKVSASLLSRFDETILMPLTLVVVPDILLDVRLSTPAELTMPESIRNHLADPSHQSEEPISVLLGAGVWAQAVRPGTHQHIQGVLAQNMAFGWIILGSVANLSKTEQFAAVTGQLEQSLDQLLERFCQLDELAILTKEEQRTPEQTACEEYFMQTFTRDPTGRYVVGIPIKQEISELGRSREIAVKRFNQLERRLQLNPELREKYIATIYDYQQHGHMQLADKLPSPITYYVPHHCVLKKFRVVFDGSCRTTSGKSINDMQMVGEKLQDDLPDLLSRFRCHRIAVTADIKQMYRQVSVRPEQWDLQRILWRNNPSEELREYWLTTVTFGMASAPHCAVRAMIQCARDHEEKWPMGARVVKNDFFVDDCLTGAATVHEAQQLCTELKGILAAGGFELGKWRSNKTLLQDELIATSDDANTAVNLLSDTTILGLRWLPESDELAFRIKTPEIDARITKRSILSCIAQLYDPTGCLGPTIVLAKLLLQHLWKRRIDWDVEVGEEIADQWIKFQKQLTILETIRIPRWLRVSPTAQFEIHGFADASESAFGAVIYFRVLLGENQSSVNLVMSKSRVAPVKKMSIPRLELCAAELLGKLATRTVSMCGWTPVRQIMWSDSTIVLHWLKTPLSELKTFVSNRIKSINDNTAQSEWRHVPTNDNPADLLSRGVPPAELPTKRLWWHGPTWLDQNEEAWPKIPCKITEEISIQIAEDRRPEKKLQLVNVITIKKSDVEFVEVAPSFYRLMRVTAIVLRYKSNWMPLEHRTGERCGGHITTIKIENARKFWLHHEQDKFFGNEIKMLKNGKVLTKGNILFTLSPRLDEEGILRVGGRLEQAIIPYAQKHPTILSLKSNLTRLIIREAHYATQHGGTQQMMGYIRQLYWIIGLRRAVRSFCVQCTTCIRMKQNSSTQMMADLPADRVRPSKAFENTGVDYAGPFLIRARSGRCQTVEKGYVAVFVCMSTKAVHLEVVPDLTTAAFIRAFQRFTSTRGPCRRVWSDNGGNFVGAENELARQLGTWPREETIDHLNTLGTQWRFITPAAPHQGGLWEAAVKTMKYHLKRVMGPQQLTYEMLDTLVKQIAGCMNSRPLMTLSDDPEDLQFLTPAHFLVGEPITQPPGPYLPTEPRNRLQLWALVQNMVQGFWKYWHENYLNQLQQRRKWAVRCRNLRVGDMVLIKSETTAPTIWPRGRIIEVHPGADGLVRNVTVKTTETVLKRAVQKLVLLPHGDDNDDDDNTQQPELNDVEDPIIEAETSRGQNVYETNEIIQNEGQ